MKQKFINPKRILLKLSGEALMGSQQFGIDVDFLDILSKNVVFLSQQKNIEIIIVIGGGNIFRGLSLAAKGLDRASADYMGMLATIMNGIALGDAIEKNGNQVRIMSAIEIPKVAESFIRRRALKHLEKGRIIIAVAGTGNPYFTTDSASVLKALELNCNYMVKGTKVDGVYDKDPVNNKDAVKYDNISLEQALKKGLRVMDQSALAMAKDEKLPIFVCDINKITQIGSDEMQGTFLHYE